VWWLKYHRNERFVSFPYLVWISVERLCLIDKIDFILAFHKIGSISDFSKNTYKVVTLWNLWEIALLRQGLTIWPRLPPNSCASLPSAGSLSISIISLLDDEYMTCYVALTISPLHPSVCKAHNSPGSSLFNPHFCLPHTCQAGLLTRDNFSNYCCLTSFLRKATWSLMECSHHNSCSLLYFA
jgi:hypothetical protein